MSETAIVGWRYKGQRYTTLALRILLIREGAPGISLYPAHTMPEYVAQMPRPTDVPSPILVGEDDATGRLIDAVDLIEGREPHLTEWTITMEVVIRGDMGAADRFADDLSKILNEDSEVVEVRTRRHW